jgi:hypothetical protein
MASMAYFRKMRENDTNIFYAYGSDMQSLTSELIFDKGSHQPSVAADDLGYTGRKAAGKIVELYLERGEWPEKGSSVS